MAMENLKTEGRQKTCPKCGESGSVDERFGWRTVQGKRIPQSYCTACRGKKAEITKADMVRAIMATPVLVATENAAKARESEPKPRWLTTKFPGRCASCDTRIPRNVEAYWQGPGTLICGACRARGAEVKPEVKPEAKAEPKKEAEPKTWRCRLCVEFKPESEPRYAAPGYYEDNVCVTCSRAHEARVYPALSPTRLERAYTEYAEWLEGKLWERANEAPEGERRCLLIDPLDEREVLVAKLVEEERERVKREHLSHFDRLARDAAEKRRKMKEDLEKLIQESKFKSLTYGLTEGAAPSAAPEGEEKP